MKPSKPFTIRFLGMLLATVLLLSYAPLSALAQEPQAPSGDYGQVTLDGTIHWDDNDNADSFRPDSLEVSLYANDVEVMKQTVSAPDWKYSFDISNGVPGFDSPKGLTFTVSHPSIDHYATTQVVHPTVQFTDPGITGGWEKISPCSSLDIPLNSSGESIVASKMTADQTVVVWSESALSPFEQDTIIRSLETDANGLGNPKQYVFLSGQGASSEYGITVQSTNVTYEHPSNWSLLFVGTYQRGAATATAGYITNTYTPEQVTVQAEKRWDDNNNQDGLRPQSIVLQLLANGQYTGKTQTVTQGCDGKWLAQWAELPRYENGQEIDYSVIEDQVPEGYSVSYSLEGQVWVVTNQYDPEKTSVTVRKIWDDADDRDGLRPASVTVELYADGVATGQTVVLTQAGQWIASFAGLDKMAAGTAIVYTVREVTEITGYEAAVYSVDPCTGYLEITNTHIPETTEITVTKVWNDDNDSCGLRPEAITVGLYREDVKVAELTLTADDGWQGEFTGLSKYENGQEIVYTVQEECVPQGYSQSVSGFVITNTFTLKDPDNPKTGDLSHVAHWFALLGASCAGLLCLALADRKRKANP